MESLFLIRINDYPLISIFWNVFLALAPCFIAYFMIKAEKFSRFNPFFIILFFLWLILLPNTAYLFFMTRHVIDYCVDFDIHRVCATGSWIPLFFFTYALIGIPTFYYALRIMTKLMMKLYWNTCELLFPLFIIPLVSVGLMFGLYERFNSWNIFYAPLRTLVAVKSYFTELVLLKDFLIFTAILYLIYFVTDYILNRD